MRKEEQQREAVDTVLKNIYEMISASVAQSDLQPQESDYVERLFLPNSQDLVRLLVNFNMIQYHPQLSACPYAASLLADN